MHTITVIKRRRKKKIKKGFVTEATKTDLNNSKDKASVGDQPGEEDEAQEESFEFGND